ncbi:MAG TPA: hypothetical protein VEA44_02965 [Caulobacter sp.]|nr:hypothetical protein [Caulobacter sp.]
MARRWWGRAAWCGLQTKSLLTLRIYTYIIDHDLGFAPNPFHGICTLAACKPQIRKYAEVGDLIIGTGSRPNNIEGRLSYWMRVDRVIDFDEYWLSNEFRTKRPVINGSRMQRYGDNIYHRDHGGNWIQANSFHSSANGTVDQPNLMRDTGTTTKVLIGRDFAYWGGNGPAIPLHLSDFVHTTQGHRCRYKADRIAAFMSWLDQVPKPSLLGRPANWPTVGS